MPLSASVLAFGFAIYIHIYYKSYGKIAHIDHAQCENVTNWISHQTTTAKLKAGKGPLR